MKENSKFDEFLKFQFFDKNEDDLLDEIKAYMKNLD
jgi:hypothetical protein